MSKIIPFKAVRPSPNKIGLVTCRNYDEYTSGELLAWLTYNPYSFLHVLNPAFTNNLKITIDKRFNSVAHKYQEFLQEKILIKEEHDVFYLYEIQTKEDTFTGLIAAISIEDYKKNNIKKHEDTLQPRVEIIKDFMEITKFNAEPVLITYPDQIALNSFIALKKKNTPIYEFSTTKKENHTLWKIDTLNEIVWLQEQFEKIPNLYIADGHHRSAAANLLKNENNKKNEKLNYFMSFLIPESNLKIYEFNRIIRDLNGHSKETFFKLLANNFEIENKKQELWKPQKSMQFGMYFDGEFYSLSYKIDTIKNYKPKSFLETLDAQILYDTVLLPIFGILDLRNDERIEYISGKFALSEIKNLVDKGSFQVGFMLYPSNISEIKTIADLQLVMPPKSTYIEPKFRNGLVIYEL